MLNRLLGYKTVTMSIPEFCALNRGELTLSDIYFNRKASRSIERICRKNSRLAMIIVFFLASMFIVQTNVYAASVDTSKIDSLGRTLLTLVQNIGYWFCIIMAAKEILTSLMQNQAKEVGGIILKHVMAFGGFYALPWIFDLIKDLLG
ncbi:hypothetical protein N2W42_001359 [Clostridium perfringens]|uniref:hypothetical protein n=1 Tax=Clostridium perfringens TaxID=1502 RepID=UPI0007763E8D|nr:hypothetical protein [Clostridium perfringens]EJT6340612.1 hypothetical protein [Clostridium perfringens]